MLSVPSVCLCLSCGSDESDHWAQVPAGTGPIATDEAIAIIDAALDALGGPSNFAKANVGRTTMEIDGAFEARMHK